MLEYPVTELDMQLAGILSDKISSVDKDSVNRLILVEDHDLIGFLGELTFEKWLIENDIDYEFHEIMDRPVHGGYDYKIGNIKIEVKSERSVERPDDQWIVYIRDYQVRKLLEDPVDIIVFVVVNIYFKKCYILGFISLDEFLEYAKPVNKGKHIRKNLVCKEEMWILPASKLRSIEELLGVLV